MRDLPDATIYPNGLKLDGEPFPWPVGPLHMEYDNGVPILVVSILCSTVKTSEELMKP